MVCWQVSMGTRSIFCAKWVCGPSGFVGRVRVSNRIHHSGEIRAIVAEMRAPFALRRNRCRCRHLQALRLSLPWRGFCDNALLAVTLTAFVELDWNRNANTLSSCWDLGRRLAVRGLGLCRGVGSGGGSTSQLVHVRRACSGRFGRAAGSRQGGSVGRVARSGSEQAPANLYCSGLQDHTQ